MINLIPPEGYQMVKREYLFRVGAVYGFLFSFVFLLITASLIPLYVLVDGQRKDISLEAVEESNTAEQFQNTTAIIEKTNSVLTQLSLPEPPFLISSAINEIQKRAPEGVSFKMFSIDIVDNNAKKKTNNTTQNIQVQGKATTREKLAQLKTSLEDSELFETVEVPISDLARDVDLSFSITIVPSK